MREKDSEELKEAQRGMPIPVPGCEGIYHCGFHAEQSFAATSYLITRPEGNILVDSPRFNPVLAKRFEELGGVKYIFLTHMCVSGLGL
jgi:glyoxylase-like metal-dependent hydrolase (beta-lactamase superfamily II)